MFREAFELPLAAQWLAEDKDIDAVICLGCVIRGDTPHFDYICRAVAQGHHESKPVYRKPVAFGVLTTLNKKAGPGTRRRETGNKGEEAAVTVVQMLAQRP